MKRRVRKILVWFGGVFLGLVLLLFVLGYFFEDKIHLMAIKELGKALNARIEVADTDVSFLSYWPDVQVELEGVTLNPIGSEGNRDVIAVHSAKLRINLWSFFSDRMEISGVRLDRPAVDLRRSPEGDWNLADMFRTQPSGEDGGSEGPLTFQLSDVRILDGRFAYEDQQEGADIALDSLFLKLSGDFNADRTDFDTELAFHLGHWRDRRWSWLRDKHVHADLLVDTQLEGVEAYRIREADVQIAAVQLNVGGDVVREDGDYRINLAYNTSRNDFDAFMSLLPGGLLDTGREYEYDGEFKVHGWVQGLAGKAKSPSVYAEYAVENGSFHYVDYESRLTEVQMSGSCLYKDDAPADSYFKVDQFTADLRGKPIVGKVDYSNFSDPRLGFELNGDLALEDVREFYPAFADSSHLKGQVSVNLLVDGRIADFRANNYRAVRASGSVDMQGVDIRDRRVVHPVEGLTGSIKVDNDHIQVTSLKGKVGHSDFDVKGLVTEYLPWFFEKDATIRGNIELASNNLDLNDWLLDEAGPTGDGEGDEFRFRLPENVDFEVRARVGQFHFAKFDAEAVTGRCHLHDRFLDLDQLSMRTLEGEMTVSGKVHALSDKRCEVRLDARASSIDINKTFRTFDQLAAFALVKENLYGRFSGDVFIAAELNEYLEIDPASLVSTGNVALANGRLVDFEPLEGLAGFVKLEDLKDIQFSDVQTTYRIQDSQFYIPGMSLSANQYKLDISGRHGFDNSLDYHVAVELPRKAAKRSRSEDVLALVDVEPETKARIVIPVHVTGTVDHPKYSLDGGFVRQSIDQSIAQEGKELRDAFSREIDEEFGGRDSLEVDDLIEVEEDSTKKAVSLLDKLKKPLGKVRFPRKGSK